MKAEDKVKQFYPTAIVKHQRSMGATWYAIFETDRSTRPTWDLGARSASRAWVLAWEIIQKSQPVPKEAPDGK